MNDDILWKIDSEIGKDKKVVELRKEIEELKDINKVLWKENRIMLSRIYKSLEYIDNVEWSDCEECMNVVYKILKGSDKE